MKNIFTKINIVAFLMILVFIIFSLKNGSTLSFNGGNVDFFAKKILVICANDSYKRGCYDREIPKLLSRGLVTMEGAFEVTTKIQNVDRSYLFCHVLGHELADIETRKDPSKWLDVVTRCPALECNNGCAHGAVMRRFKGSDVLSDTQLAEILPDLKIACEPRGNWKPSELEISMCYHSMGHLGMYITDADVTKSLAVCHEIAIKDDGKNYYQTCVQGVFMLIFQSLDDDDVALVSKIKPTKENLESFCAKYKGLEHVACKTEAWPYFYTDFAKPSGLTNFCNFTKGEYYRNWCFDIGVRGQLSMDILQSDGVDGVAKYCLGLPKDIVGRCFPSIATAWVQDEPRYITESVALCEEAKKYGYSDGCYKGLLFFSKFSFIKGSDLWKNYCNHFSGVYKDKCYSGDVPDSW